MATIISLGIFYSYIWAAMAEYNNWDRLCSTMSLQFLLFNYLHKTLADPYIWDQPYTTEMPSTCRHIICQQDLITKIIIYSIWLWNFNSYMYVMDIVVLVSLTDTLDPLLIFRVCNILEPGAATWAYSPI